MARPKSFFYYSIKVNLKSKINITIMRTIPIIVNASMFFLRARITRDKDKKNINK